MNEKFAQYVNQMPTLLDEIMSCSPQVGLPKQEIKLPARAVYLFSRSEEHLYVGRTNRLRQRIKEHLKGRNNDAPFAFKMARHATGLFKGKGQPTRKELENHEIFSPAFIQAKTDLAALQWRFVEIADPNLQCLFEIYASISLEAKFNDFENH